MNYLKIPISILLIFNFLTISSCVQNTSATGKFNKAKNSSREEVNGEIISQTGNVTVLKVWGTHKERGYAYGYLLGDKIREVYEGYIGYVFKPYIAKAKKAIKSNQLLKIEQDYLDECKAIIEGMDAAGFNTKNFDYLDLLVANSFLDLRAIMGSDAEPNGCSSLMAWGEATNNEELGGKSIITRNLDWSVSTKLIKNNIVLIHIPSEVDEQPWLSIGYIGHCGALSGTNQSGLSVFQHVMYDDFKNREIGKYEPVWFSVRKALEKKDYDQSGQNDVNDLKKVLLENENGYADGYILSAMASSDCGADSLIAMVAELGPEKPFISIRNNSFEDKFDGKLLYAANYPICRNNQLRYGTRYNSTSGKTADYKSIDSKAAWEIMTTASCLKNTNLQTMQIIPESGILKLSVWENNKGAYANKPKTYDLKGLFSTIDMQN
jgi:hypothetical protein